MKNSYAMTIVYFVLISCALLNLSSAEPLKEKPVAIVDTATTQAVAINLKMSKTQYGLNESVEVAITLSNSSAQPIYFEDIAIEQNPGVKLSVLRNGTPVSVSSFSKTTKSSYGRWFLKGVLDPQCKAKWHFSLNRLYDFSIEGDYTVDFSIQVHLGPDDSMWITAPRQEFEIYGAYAKTPESRVSDAKKIGNYPWYDISKVVTPSTNENQTTVLSVEQYNDLLEKANNKYKSEHRKK